MLKQCLLTLQCMSVKAENKNKALPAKTEHRACKLLVHMENVGPALAC